jgi:hypothetical protein
MNRARRATRRSGTMRDVVATCCCCRGCRRCLGCGGLLLWRPAPLSSRPVVLGAHVNWSHQALEGLSAATRLARVRLEVRPQAERRPPIDLKFAFKYVRSFASALIFVHADSSSGALKRRPPPRLDKNLRSGLSRAAGECEILRLDRLSSSSSAVASSSSSAAAVVLHFSLLRSTRESHSSICPNHNQLLRPPACVCV